MKEQIPDPGRREFLKAGVAAAALTTTAGQRLVSAQPRAEDIPTRPFGKTGRVLPILGMGSSAMVNAWSRGYGSRPSSVEERAALVRHAYDRGVRYLDTGRSYHDAEEVIGKGLKGVSQDCFIATKVTTRYPARVRPSVEESLRVLGVNRLDAVQIHSSGAIEHGGFGPGMEIHAELVKLREEGLLRYIGLTTHVAFETVYQMIATGGFDQALLTVRYFNKGMNTLLSEQNRAFREKYLDKARDLGMGVVAMKVMGVSIYGRMSKVVVPDCDPAKRAKLPAAAMRWALNDGRVTLLAIGMGHHEEIEQNAATLSSDLTLTEEDRELLADYSAKAYESPRLKTMGVDQQKKTAEQMAEAVIKQSDRNHDGKLSRREAPPKLARSFAECDRDGDGFVSRQELTDALRRRQRPQNGFDERGEAQ